MVLQWSSVARLMQVLAWPAAYLQLLVCRHWRSCRDSGHLVTATLLLHVCGQSSRQRWMPLESPPKHRRPVPLRVMSVCRRPFIHENDGSRHHQSAGRCLYLGASCQIRCRLRHRAHQSRAHHRIRILLRLLTL